jgi:hypothetical protein
MKTTEIAKSSRSALVAEKDSNDTFHAKRKMAEDVLTFWDEDLGARGIFKDANAKIKVLHTELKHVANEFRADMLEVDLLKYVYVDGGAPVSSYSYTGSNDNVIEVDYLPDSEFSVVVNPPEDDPFAINKAILRLENYWQLLYQDPDRLKYGTLSAGVPPAFWLSMGIHNGYYLNKAPFTTVLGVSVPQPPRYEYKSTTDPTKSENYFYSAYYNSLAFTHFYSSSSNGVSPVSVAADVSTSTTYSSSNSSAPAILNSYYLLFSTSSSIISYTKATSITGSSGNWILSLTPVYGYGTITSGPYNLVSMDAGSLSLSGSERNSDSSVSKFGADFTYAKNAYIAMFDRLVSNIKSSYSSSSGALKSVSNIMNDSGYVSIYGGNATHVTNFAAVITAANAISTGNTRFTSNPTALTGAIVQRQADMAARLISINAKLGYITNTTGNTSGASTGFEAGVSGLYKTRFKASSRRYDKNFGTVTLVGKTAENKGSLNETKQTADDHEDMVNEYMYVSEIKDISAARVNVWIRDEIISNFTGEVYIISDDVINNEWCFIRALVVPGKTVSKMFSIGTEPNTTSTTKISNILKKYTNVTLSRPVPDGFDYATDGKLRLVKLTSAAYPITV